MPICEHCGKEYSERQIRRHRAEIRDQENQVFIAALMAMDVDLDPQAHNHQPPHGDDPALYNHDGVPDVNPPPLARHDVVAHVDNVFPQGGEPAVQDDPAPDDENPVAHDENMVIPVLNNIEPALDRAGPRWQAVDLEAAIADEEVAAPPGLEAVDGGDALENNHPVPPPPPVMHPLVGVRHNPPVAVDEWFAEDWIHEDFDDEPLDDEFIEEPDRFDDELLQDIDERITEPALSIGYGASIASMEHEPEFHELDEPAGVNPDNEPEMNDGQFWEYLRDEFGDLAEEEWVDMYTRILTDQDRASLTFLAARQRSHFSRAIYDDLRLNACEAIGLPSDFVAWRRLKILSGLESRTYDCCVNSCICYIGMYSDLEQCRFCNAPRFNAAGEPRRKFNYTPLIPQLLGLFQNPDSIKKMRHRAGHDAYRAAHPGVMEDVFDGELYHRLRNTRVNENSEYKFFDAPDDIALGLGTDGFSMFKRRHKGNSTAWPLILVNYNLHASIRNRLENVICVGVIPGPKECKDINSFLAPLIEELEALEAGVEASKVASEVDNIQGEGANFLLHAFLIILFGDIPAVSKLLMLKGHRGKAPCRACLILGTEHRGEAGSVTYYVPLITPDNEVLLPEELSMRTHDTYLFYYNQLETIQGVGARAQLATDCGLNGRPLFTRLKSIDLSSCAPYELMHLFFENLVPNMISHWKGIFKGIEDDAAYRISADDWKIIGEQTAQATRTIPGQFVGTIPNIDIDMGLFKAEAFAFWFMYLAPILLSGRLARAYYEHFLAMREIFIWTLDMGITPEQVDTLETMIQDWVKEYERLYYRYDYDRLPTCPVTIHALLHIPHYIRQLGPLTLFWCFLMERFCGYLLRPALLNRVRPYEYLDNFIRRRAQLQIVARVHNMPALIKSVTHRTLVGDEYISQKEMTYPGFEDIVFGQPVRRGYPANDALQRQIARYFGFPEGRDLTIEQHRARVDWRTLVRHGRFRLASMGDRVRVADRIKNDSIARDNSFVRYELLPDRNANFQRREDRPMRLINYGQVIDVFYVEYVRDQGNERVPYILARVRECSDTRGLDATDPRTPIVTYNRLDAPKVINLKTVHSAVGRIKIGGRHTWAIIDRSRGARTQFNDENGQPDPDLN